MGYRYLTICDLSQFCRAFFHEDHFSSLAIPHCLHASIHFLTRLLLWVLLQAHHFSHVFLHSISRPLLVYFSLSTLLFLISQRKSHSSSKFFFASCIYDNPAHIFLCAICFCFPDFCKLFGSQFPAFVLVFASSASTPLSQTTHFLLLTFLSPSFLISNN